MVLILSGCMVNGDLPTGTDECPDVVVYMTFGDAELVVDSIEGGKCVGASE
jgi:hypothetical protein